MELGEKFLLNVSAAKAADKAVAKGLREIFPKLTSCSQLLEVGRELRHTLVFLFACSCENGIIPQ